MLDEKLEFETGLEKDLFVSQEINRKYEDIIKQRIKDEMFDDRTFEAFYLNKLVREEQQFSMRNAGTHFSNISLFSTYIQII